MIKYFILHHVYSYACMVVIDCTHKKENILGFSELNYILLYNYDIFVYASLHTFPCIIISLCTCRIQEIRQTFSTNSKLSRTMVEAVSVNYGSVSVEQSATLHSQRRAFQSQMHVNLIGRVSKLSSLLFPCRCMQ